MIGIADVWDTYVATHDALVQNWLEYLSEAGSRHVARISLARLTQLAGVGWETQSGPYAELIDLGVNSAIQQGFVEGRSTLGPVESHILVPTDALLIRLSQAYAAIYHLAYSGEWSFMEREHLTLRVRTGTPVWHNKMWLKAHLFNPADQLGFLRRAFDATKEHAHGAELICVASDVLRIDEQAKSLDWAQQARRLEGART